MVRNFAIIISLLSLTLLSARCGDNDDKEEVFRYLPDNCNNSELSITFDLGTETVDSTFLSRTSGYCPENRKDLQIKAGGDHSFVVKIPSPNRFKDEVVEHVDTATVTRKDYVSDLTIDGQKGTVKAFFTMIIPDRFKDYYMDFEFELTQIEIGGRKVDVSPITAASGKVSLTKDAKGRWQLVE